MERPIHRVVDLIDQKSQQIYNMELDEARELLLRDDATSLMRLLGSFALTAREGEVVRMARSLDRPMRYFLAKQESGPLLVVADRIDEIEEFLETQGYGDQFHPSYTRMVPAHHVTSIRLIGCPDPNPIYQRFLEPLVREFAGRSRHHRRALCRSALAGTRFLAAGPATA